MRNIIDCKNKKNATVLANKNNCIRCINDERGDPIAVNVVLVIGVFPANIYAIGSINADGRTKPEAAGCQVLLG